MESNGNIDMEISVWYLIKEHRFEFKGPSFKKVLEAIIKEAGNPNSEFEWRHAHELCMKKIIPALREENELADELLVRIETANSENK